MPYSFSVIGNFFGTYGYPVFPGSAWAVLEPWNAIYVQPIWGTDGDDVLTPPSVSNGDFVWELDGGNGDDTLTSSEASVFRPGFGNDEVIGSAFDDYTLAVSHSDASRRANRPL